MKVVVNGAAMDVTEGATLKELVRELGLEQRPIAVELNRRVVPKDRYEATRLAPSDTLEIVSLVGGG